MFQRFLSIGIDLVDTALGSLYVALDWLMVGRCKPVPDVCVPKSCLLAGLLKASCSNVSFQSVSIDLILGWYHFMWLGNRVPGVCVP